MERKSLEEHIRALERKVYYLTEKVNQLETAKNQNINLLVTIKESDANDK